MSGRAAGYVAHHPLAPSSERRVVGDFAPLLGKEAARGWLNQGSKVRAGGLVVWESAQVEEAKTKTLRATFERTALKNALIIDGAEPQTKFASAARNLPEIDVLPVQGVNVYDIMRREKLVLTKAAVEALEARFK